MIFSYIKNLYKKGNFFFYFHIAVIITDITNVSVFFFENEMIIYKYAKYLGK